MYYYITLYQARGILYSITTLASGVTKFFCETEKTRCYNIKGWVLMEGVNNKFKPNNHPENVFFKYSCEMNYV